MKFSSEDKYRNFKFMSIINFLASFLKERVYKYLIHDDDLFYILFHWDEIYKYIIFNAWLIYKYLALKIAKYWNLQW